MSGGSVSGGWFVEPRDVVVNGGVRGQGWGGGVVGSLGAFVCNVWCGGGWREWWVCLGRVVCFRGYLLSCVFMVLRKGEVDVDNIIKWEGRRRQCEGLSLRSLVRSFGRCAYHCWRSRLGGCCSGFGFPCSASVSPVHGPFGPYLVFCVVWWRGVGCCAERVSGRFNGWA